MNDRYLFRGKRLDNGEWVVGYLFADTAPCSMKLEGKCVCRHDGSSANIYAWDDCLHEYCAHDVDSATIGQCTGLRDENETLIFEGDVVSRKSPDGREVNYLIKWSDFRGHFLGDNPDEIYDVAPGVFSSTEIIGNVHDNPELLEGANDDGKY